MQKEVPRNVDITISPNTRTVEFWLTHAEKQDAALREQLNGLCRECKAKGLQPVLFLSGENSLAELTGELLRYNRDRMAALEVRRERMQKAAM